MATGMKIYYEIMLECIAEKGYSAAIEDYDENNPGRDCPYTRSDFVNAWWSGYYDYEAEYEQMEREIKISQFLR